MEIINNILFWIHLVSLSVGGAATFGIPVIGALLPTAPPEARPTLFKAMKGISTVSRGGLAGLVITGPILVFTKYQGFGDLTWWFWLKMVLVLILIGLVIWAGLNSERASKGDMEAVKRAPMIGGAAMITLLAVVFTAVFAFT